MTRPAAAVPLDAPPGGSQVSSFVVHQPLVGGLEQPNTERHRPAHQVVGQLPPRHVVCLLDDIGRVETRLDLGPQAPPYRRFDGRKMACEEAIDRARVTRGDLLQEQRRFGGISEPGIHLDGSRGA
jgi:hypothetical protein